MLTSTFSKDLIVLKVLDLSQTRCHQDVTIVCSNGTVKSNSFLLASIFPVFGDFTLLGMAEGIAFSLVFYILIYHTRLEAKF